MKRRPSSLPRVLLRALLSAVALAPIVAQPAQAQMIVNDPLNLIQTALNATRALQQINNQVQQITNQIRQLENDARNLTRLGDTFAPEIMTKLREMDALLNEARGLALRVGETRAALESLYTGDYRGTDVATRAQAAARQIDAARSALQTSLIVQAQATEQLRTDQTTLQALTSASANATGALSAQQATNELLAFQAQQSMRLQALLVAESRAEALERARQMEVQAQARAQHDHFFSGAQTAHPGQKPWN
ncbi:P-type conjugative transfer protein TrbJ [bacterium]|nr:P-type conjugative transfer protein TrbJ [bacterium]